MSKNYIVTSKRKNPDKYIDKLKSHIAYYRSGRDFYIYKWLEEQGQNWIGEQDDILETEMSLELAQQAKIGQKIVIYGIISELLYVDNSHAEAKFELGEVRLKEDNK